MSDQVHAADLPGNDAARLLALRNSGLLQSGMDVLLEALVHRAAILFNVPIAALSLSDETRKIFKSSIGLGLPFANEDLVFCGDVALGKEPLFLLNPRSDSRFANSAVVQGPPGIRFFAGASVFGPENKRLGVLCVMDRRARQGVAPEELAALKSLAGEVSSIFISARIEIKPDRTPYNG